MKTFQKISIFILLIFAFQATAQISGTVFGTDEFGNRETIVGAQISLVASKFYTQTNARGKFNLPAPTVLPDTLIIRFIGHHSDTLILETAIPLELEITLFSDNVRPEVIIEARQNATSILKMEPLFVQNLSENEFRKAACCNISEAFETNASVDVSMPDPISGQRRIQMLGLDGIYTQINLENVPYFRGLSYAFGMSSIPGTWANSIQVTKGTGSVVHGYESMAGMINIELKQAENHDLLYINGYGNLFGRAELNVQTARHFGQEKKWSSALFAHGSGFFMEVDNNKDGFRDFPLGHTFSALNRWSYEGKRYEMKTIIAGHYDNKIGGQLGYDPRVTSGLFGAQIQNQDLEVISKMGFFLKNRPEGSIALLSKGKIYSNNTYIGNNQYQGDEKRFYFNSIYSDILGCKSRKIQTGLSLVVADFNERLINGPMPARDFSRLEIIPGAFGEFTWTKDKFNMLAGFRGDYHNLFGFIPSPRLHMKYSPTKTTDLRVSGGRAWRVPNYVADNMGMLATNRIWVNMANLEPEISWNVGGSVVQSFDYGQTPFTLTVDYFHTRFEKQLILDMEDQYFVFFYNLQGTSFSNTLQTELTTEPMQGLELRFVYKFTDVRTTFGGIFQQRMMVPRHRGMFNAGYRTPNKKWEFDFTTTVMGMMRLTHIQGADGVKEPEQTKPFAVLNAQITHVWKNWDFYIGGENLTNYIQRDAIVGADNPFGTTFDATRVYAPISGVNVYVGFRYKIARKTDEH
jgi:outer membrane receptor for ferrienterochelin and colicins